MRHEWRGSRGIDSGLVTWLAWETWCCSWRTTFALERACQCSEGRRSAPDPHCAMIQGPSGSWCRERTLATAQTRPWPRTPWKTSPTTSASRGSRIESGVESPLPAPFPPGLEGEPPARHSTPFSSKPSAALAIILCRSGIPRAGARTDAWRSAERVTVPRTPTPEARCSHLLSPSRRWVEPRSSRSAAVAPHLKTRRDSPRERQLRPWRRSPPSRIRLRLPRRIRRPPWSLRPRRPRACRRAALVIP